VGNSGSVPVTAVLHLTLFFEAAFLHFFGMLIYSIPLITAFVTWFLLLGAV